MKRKLYVLALVALSLTACQPKEPSYTISGTVSEEYKDGETIYLMKSVKKKGLVKLDSAIIKNGKFTFTGRQDTTVCRILKSKRIYESFYLENGHIIADIRNGKITGTPNNDAYYAFWSGFIAYTKELNEVEHKFIRATIGSKEKEEYRKQMNELKKKLSEYCFNGIAANIDNLVVGRSLFLNYNYGLSTEQLKELIAMMPSETLKDLEVQRIIKQIENSYTITGTVKGIEDATMAYLSDVNIKFSSTEVKDGKFTFTGYQDSTTTCFIKLYKGKESLLNSPCLFFLEKGNITATLSDKPYEYRVTGTPNNDIYQAYIDVHNALLKKIEEYEIATTDIAEDERIKEDNIKVDEAYNNILDNHMNSAVALHFFTHHFTHPETDPERVLELVPKLPEAYLSNPKVQAVIEKAKQKVKTFVGKPFIDFEMPTADGSTAKLSDIVKKNKYTVVIFWNNTCDMYINAWMDVYNEFGKKGIGFVSVSSDKKEAKWKAALEKWKTPATHMCDLKGTEESEGFVLYSVFYQPEYVIISQDGTIVERELYNGYKKNLTDKLEKLLK